MEAVQAQVLSHYRSELVEHIRSKGNVISAGDLTVKLAKEFGFCYGEKKHADITENAGLIKQMLDAPGGSKALKEFFNQEPEKALEYLNLKVRAAKQFIKDSAAKVIEAQKQKELKAASTPPFGPASGGAASIGGGKSTDKGIGYQIAHASMGY